MKQLLTVLLFPFAILYNLVTKARNHLYNIGSRPSIQFDLPVISVGNLTVGGTGKTPHIEWLIRLLKDEYSIATLSRGYGRKTKGFLLANPDSKATDIGDEPMQFFTKFGEQVTVSVGEERALAIPSILHEQPDTQVILLDDAYQHRRVNPSFNILLTDFHRPFYKDFLLPAGRLRESREGAKRANIIVVSKCPEHLSKTEQETIAKQIRPYAKENTPIYFSTIEYGTPVNIHTEETLTETKQPVILLTGIAQTGPLETYIQQKYELLQHISFSDHADYTSTKIEHILSEVKKHHAQQPIIITTEKDAVKLKGNHALAQLPIYSLGIQIAFLNQEADQVEEAIRNNILSFSLNR